MMPMWCGGLPVCMLQLPESTCNSMSVHILHLNIMTTETTTAAAAAMATHSYYSTRQLLFSNHIHIVSVFFYMSNECFCFVTHANDFRLQLHFTLFLSAISLSQMSVALKWKLNFSHRSICRGENARKRKPIENGDWRQEAEKREKKHYSDNVVESHWSHWPIGVISQDISWLISVKCWSDCGCNLVHASVGTAYNFAYNWFDSFISNGQ